MSILKPLKGVDDELEANLESFCGLDYPEYQLILSAQDEDDPALVVARRIRDRHPQLDIEVVCNSERRGLNPKVSNLLSCTGHAKHDIILVSDSNVRVRPSYLAETVSKLEEEEVMLVSNVIRGTGERSFSAGS
ncbi:MAG: glycosyltransferase [Planctomycetota bacterium]|nr:glycosyltransferase [Planctomycetota bacterium]